ncbi:MAG TPA: transglutaminase-like domain-containing protein, partial [Ilumatobacteraceae bacterium]|nr:transglutaminase-like domain-containing protein [Ilumatobacteraceae bacterium]
HEPRPAANRVGARCHVYSRLTVALLRAAGVPARARCGFGAYFRPGWFEDHWVAEYWDADESRWQMVDAQLDDVWLPLITAIDDPLRITGQQFVTAGHAWQAWRRGELDDSRCGLSSIDEHGAHWIAGNLRLDFASLNKVEMLPWDVWGEGWEPGEEPTDQQLQLFDEIAALTTDPDSHIDELRNRYDTDASLRMDGTVFNVARGQVESV